MPTFSYREKNDTISVRCGARCRAYHASSMGEGKGSPHSCAAARFLFFGFFNSMESAFPYEESFSVRPNPVRRRLCWRRPPRKALFLRPDVVPHPLQTLVPPSEGTTSLGPNGLSSVRTWCLIPCKALCLRRRAPRPNGLSSGRTWCLIPRKPLFLRPEAPRLSAGPSLRRPGRGTSPSAKPYSSVRRHHVYRPGRASSDPDVVLHRPQSLIPSSGSTTSSGPNGLSSGPTWCLTPCKALCLRPEAPCLSAGPSLRRPGRGASPSAKPYFFVRKHHATWVRLSLRRLGRGASPSAKPYFFVRKHHVLRPNGPACAADVVPHPPQSLMPPSGGTTSSGFPFPIRRECDEHI